MKTQEIRDKFLNFFQAHGHSIVPSSSLVPGDDPTLLFTNAGMVQFKDVFLGKEKRPYTRATTAQRCVRAGGKHNDLENVGYTARHHTLFEMLGNFSFGDYFKSEAIHFAWQFLIHELKLPKEKLWVTVFQDDDEAYNIWTKEIQFPADRISRCGEKDNFWSMGDTGPCGPCSEIFYDHGEAIFGGPPGSPEADGDRYIEIWNMVFMQYERFADGRLTLLPKPSVDTGMGLERIAAVMQGVHDNYDIDLFQYLIQFIAKLTNTTDLQNRALRVLADHIRSCAFLIMDGVMPSNEGRGYVLRRIMRRALRYGHQLGMREPFFYHLVKPLGDVMGEAYPELRTKQALIEKILQQEEEQFILTLGNGLKILEQSLAKVSHGILPGEVAFKLYDTYGFPVDLTADILRERQLNLDMSGFEKAMEKQRTQSQQASQFDLDYTQQIKTEACSEFFGYEEDRLEAMITALFKGNQPVNTLHADEEGIVILDHTPFYAEAGGQVGDLGLLLHGEAAFSVRNTTRLGQAYLHQGLLSFGSLSVGDQVTAEVNVSRRESIKRNHSATHLLHAALRRCLGEHVMQKGSLVEAERLRFDFSHTGPLSTHEITHVETLVNEEILKNSLVEATLMPIDQAKNSGAMMLFGEKYGDEVRVLSMGDFSKELCGGTHVNRTGDIGSFMIIEEIGIASGVRRIVALTGSQVIRQWQQDRIHRAEWRAIFSAPSVEKQQEIAKRNQELLKMQEKRIEQLAVSQLTHALMEQKKCVNQSYFIVAEVDCQIQHLRLVIDELITQSAPIVVMLAVKEPEKITLVAGVSPSLTAIIKAGELIKKAAQMLGGKGGGKADYAQGGGTKTEKLSATLETVRKDIQQDLQKIL